MRRLATFTELFIIHHLLQEENFDVGLSYFFALCSELEELDVSENVQLVGESFEFLPKKIRKLNLMACHGFARKSVEFVCQKASSLIELNVSGLNIGPAFIRPQQQQQQCGSNLMLKK